MHKKYKIEKNRNNNQGEDGYTLMELIIVISVLVLLATIITPQIMNYFSRAQSGTVEIQIQNVKGALELFRIDVGRYPTDEEGLEALIANENDIQGWRGPYLDSEDLLQDPWGNPLMFRYPGEHSQIDIFSYGADGNEGGTGTNTDIGNWRE